MNQHPFTVSFRFHRHGTICEVRKTLWRSRRPSLSNVISIANHLFGPCFGCCYSVISGLHAWDGDIPENSWFVLPISYAK